MKSDKLKKILIFTHLVIFSLGLFFPFHQSEAQNFSNRLVITASKLSFESGADIFITARVYNLDNKTIYFDSSPTTGATFIPSSCTTTNKDLNLISYCQVGFKSTKEGTFNISASTNYNGTLKSNDIQVSITASGVSATICPIGQTLVNGICTPPVTPPVTPPATPSAVSTDTTYTPLASLPGLPESFDTKTDCAFGTYLNIIIKLIIGISAVLAMVMITMGGIEYMTSELVSGKAAGKETIEHALFGLLIALGAWLILNTINPKFLDTCLKMPPATIVLGDSVPQSPINGKYCTNTASASGGYTNNASWATSTGIGTLSTLPTGVVVSPNNDCATVGQPYCTSLRGLNTSTIKTIRTKCLGCGTITVTGGTECWLHGGARQSTTHRPGSPTIDLRLESGGLDDYIKSGTQNGSWYEKDGISYLLESNHWHVGK